MYIELLDFGWEESITIEDVISEDVNLQDFELCGWKIYGNNVLDYFYRKESLDLYLNLSKYINWAVHWSKHSIENSIEDPLPLYPLGHYISKTQGNQVAFRPVSIIPVIEQNPEQKKLSETEGRVFFREIEGQTLTVEVDEFLRQLRAPVPELTTMLHYIVEGELVKFQPSEETDKELLRLYVHLEESGAI